MRRHIDSSQLTRLRQERANKWISMRQTTDSSTLTASRKSSAIKSEACDPLAPSGIQNTIFIDGRECVQTSLPNNSTRSSDWHAQHTAGGAACTIKNDLRDTTIIDREPCTDDCKLDTPSNPLSQNVILRNRTYCEESRYVCPCCTGDCSSCSIPECTTCYTPGVTININIVC
jgi:hypothetical protein